MKNWITPSVDSIVSDFTKLVNKLNAASARHSTDAENFSIIAAEALAHSNAASNEAARAAKLANNIKNLIS